MRDVIDPGLFIKTVELLIKHEDASVKASVGPELFEEYNALEEAEFAVMLDMSLGEVMDYVSGSVESRILNPVSELGADHPVLTARIEYGEKLKDMYGVIGQYVLSSYGKSQIPRPRHQLSLSVDRSLIPNDLTNVTASLAEGGDLVIVNKRRPTFELNGGFRMAKLSPTLDDIQTVQQFVERISC